MSVPMALSAGGLLLDIAGVLLLMFFELPRSTLTADGYDTIVAYAREEDKRTITWSNRLARLGLVLLLVGFALQLLSALWPAVGV